MTATLTREGSVVRLSLSGDLPSAEAESLHQDLFAEIDAACSLIVDAAGVTHLGAAVAQILVVAARRVQSVLVETSSTEWAAAWRVLGMTLVPPAARERDDLG